MSHKTRHPKNFRIPENWAPDKSLSQYTAFFVAEGTTHPHFKAKECTVDTYQQTLIFELLHKNKTITDWDEAVNMILKRFSSDEETEQNLSDLYPTWLGKEFHHRQHIDVHILAAGLIMVIGSGLILCFLYKSLRYYSIFYENKK